MIQTQSFQRRYLVLAALLGIANLLSAAEPVRTPPVHAVCDLGHQFTFYADGRFHRQYLPGQPYISCWGALYRFDLSNVNLLILPGCEPQLRYLPKDITTLKQFMAAGGGVLIFGSTGGASQNRLLMNFQCRFAGRARGPLQAASPDITGAIEGHADWIDLTQPAGWEVLIADADGRPVLARRRWAQGTLLVSARGLAGSRPDAKDNINAHWWQPLLVQTARHKPVDPNKPVRSLRLNQLEYTEQLGNIKLHYSEYLKPYARAMADIYQRTKPVIQARMGVELSKGMASEIGLLATGGGGFSAGHMLGLAVFWGGFPQREDSMIEFITHESVHSWVLPFAEIWNEPIATYVGNLVMIDMGYGDEARRRIERTIERARRIDPTMKRYDLSGNSRFGDKPLQGGRANDMHWGKTFWIFEQLRAENPTVVADYFRAKRRLVQPDRIRKYDASTTVAVMSAAMGRDLFGWFREHGFDVDPSRSAVPVEVPTPRP